MRRKCSGFLSWFQLVFAVGIAAFVLSQLVVVGCDPRRRRQPPTRVEPVRDGGAIEDRFQPPENRRVSDVVRDEPRSMDKPSIDSTPDFVTHETKVKEAKAWCGNGICEPTNNETAAICPQDCKGPVCGNGTCDTGETSQSCPKDCPPQTRCGDGKCDAGESPQSCPKDCQQGPVCGDGTCEAGETSQNCPKDCPPTSKIWQPAPGTTWQWQLSGKLDTSFKVQMYDIDLFDHSAATIAKLQAKGIKVICYFSAGSYEKWRSDASSFPKAALGRKMSGWDELWLDIRHQGVYDVMRKRIALAKQKGCDGVEPDNVDGYQNRTDFPLKASDQLKFNRFLATEAHKLGLSIGLKNDLDQVKELVKDFDFAVNEECVKYNECKVLLPFINAGKAVFHVEYPPQTTRSVCSKVKSYRFSTLIKKLDLGAWRQTCP